MLDHDLMIAPYGGRLVNLLAAPDESAGWHEYAGALPALQLSERATCDLELLAVGAFSPLDRFMGARDYQRVLDEMRLHNGHIFPVPVTLPVERDAHLREGQEIALRS